MVVEFGEIRVDVAGTEGVGKQAMLRDERAGTLHIAPDGGRSETLLTLAQGVAKASQQAISTVVHDGLVETRVEAGVGAQVLGVESRGLFLDGGVKQSAITVRSVSSRPQMWRAECSSTSMRAS